MDPRPNGAPLRFLHVLLDKLRATARRLRHWQRLCALRDREGPSALVGFRDCECIRPYLDELALPVERCVVQRSVPLVIGGGNLGSSSDEFLVMAQTKGDWRGGTVTITHP